MVAIHITPDELAAAPSRGSPIHRYIDLGHFRPWHSSDTAPEVTAPEGWQVCRVSVWPPDAGTAYRWFAEVAPVDQPSVIARLTAAAMYILEVSREDMEKSKLHTLLYYADRAAFEAEGRSITGATYIRFPSGPIPQEWAKAYDTVVEYAMVLKPPPQHDPNQYRLRHIRPYRMGALPAHDMKTLALTVQRHRAKDGSAMTAWVRGETAWIIRQDGDEMPLSQDVWAIVPTGPGAPPCERHN